MIRAATVIFERNRQAAISVEPYLSVGVKLISAHVIPAFLDYCLIGPHCSGRYDACGRERAEWRRSPSDSVFGPGRAKRNGQRDGKNSRAAGVCVVVDRSEERR